MEPVIGERYSDMKPMKDTHILVFLMSAVVFTAAVVVFSFFSFDLDIPPIESHSVTSYLSGWNYRTSSESGTISDFPLSVTQSEITISNVLPETDNHNNILFLQTSFRTVRASVNDSVIYESGINTTIPFGTVFGVSGHMIELPYQSEGSTIIIELSSPIRSTGNTISGIKLSTGTSFLLQTLRDSLPDLVLCLLSIIFGLICVVLSFLLAPGARGYNGKSLLYLGLFMIFTSFWTYPGLNMLTIFSSNKVWLFLLYYASFMLTPVPILMFFRSVFHSGKQLLSFLSTLFLYNFISQIILYLMNRTELADTIIITHGLMIFSLLTIFVLGLLEIFRYKNKIFEIVVGSAGMIVFSILDLGRYYLQVPDGLGSTHFFKHGFLIMIISLTIYAFRERLYAMNALSELDVYQRLAYVDSITKLANRTAYDKELQVIQRNLSTYDSISFIMFDLNNLKITNDTFGHSVGDELIISFSDCLTSIFSEKGHCYRTGGDEFIVILTNRTKQEVEAMLRQLHNAVDLHNITHPYMVDYACGYAFDTLEHPRPEILVRLLREADVNMYSEKRKHRGISVRAEA